MTYNSEIVKKKVWAVAGGKGGTGKSVISANLGIALASLGYRVILVDADLGAPNLHTCLNIKRPSFTLNDFLTNRVPDLKSILLDTPNNNLKLISGGIELLGLANIHYQRKMKLIRHLNKLGAEFIIVDLGGGTTYNTLDFFNLSNEGILVCNPEPNARVDAYSFLKNVVWRKLSAFTRNNGVLREVINRTNYLQENRIFEVSKLLELVKNEDENCFRMMGKILNDFKPKLIMNKVRRRSQIDEGKQLVILTEEFLKVKLEYLGYIEIDQHVIDSTERMMPFVLEYPKCEASKNIFQIIKNLIGGKEEEKSFRHFKKDMRIEARQWK